MATSWRVRMEQAQLLFAAALTLLDLVFDVQIVAGYLAAGASKLVKTIAE